MKRTMGILTLIILVGSLIGAASGYGQDEIQPNQLIRLHVLANSDSEEDQQLKYKVKDEIVKHMRQSFAHSDSLEESRGILLSSLPEIQAIAEQKLAENGSKDEVSIQYGDFMFPTKYYGSFSLPAGEYEAVRIIIGEGQGANWWCVLFPPLCFVDQETDGVSSSYVADDGQEVTIGFRFTKLLGNIGSRLAQLMDEWLIG